MRTVLHERAQCSTVALLRLTGKRKVYSAASAFFISKRLLLTSLSILAPERPWSSTLKIISIDERLRSVEIAHSDPKTNIALLRLKEGELPSANWLTVANELPQQSWPTRIYGFDCMGDAFTFRCGRFCSTAECCPCADPECCLRYGSTVFAIDIPSTNEWIGAPVVDAYTGNAISVAWGCPEEDNTQVIGSPLIRLADYAL